MQWLPVSALCFGALTSASAWAKPVKLVLRLQERVSMDQLAQDVTDPTSPRFGQFYTPEEIRELAAPTADDYAALVARLQAAGLAVVSESASHLVITVSAEPQTVAALFGGKAAAPGLAPELLAGVASVTTPSGGRHAHPMLRLGTGETHASGVSVDKIRSVYGFSALYSQGLTGAGQHIAIATYDDFYIDDVRAYYTRHSISPAPQIDQVKFNGNPTYSDQLSDVETAIDAQFSGALAPGAAIHVFTSSTNDDAGELQMFTAILDDNRAKIVNYSWGECESDLTPAHRADMDTVFKRAVAQGVNLLVASGDSGAYCPADATKVEPDYPGAHPAIVSVGGTKLNTTASSLSEVAWTYTKNGGGSGGGISTLWDRPDYQHALPSPFIKRSYPDISFNADPASGQAGYVRITIFGTHADTPTDFVLGGTSIAAPQWAGFLALVGEARAKAGKRPLGFLNPILYAMTPGDQAVALHPILSGNNGPYQAGPGWNAVCGWGSLHADQMLAYLVRQ